jgi:hypothetical protein
LKRRREFITLVAGAAATWPLAARAQQADRMRRIGVLLPATPDDAQYQDWVGAFGGLIVPASPPTVIHRDLIARLAAQHRLPTVYNERMFVVADGLMSYGPDQIDQFRHAAGYVGSRPQGREAGRPAGAGADQLQATN